MTHRIIETETPPILITRSDQQHRPRGTRIAGGRTAGESKGGVTTHHESAQTMAREGNAVGVSGNPSPEKNGTLEQPMLIVDSYMNDLAEDGAGLISHWESVRGRVVHFNRALQIIDMWGP